MYIVQVLSGKEDSVKHNLQRMGIDCFIPKIEKLERKKGKWHKRKRLVFSSYVFIDKEEIDSDDYHRVISDSNVIRFLGEKGKPQKLTDKEELFVKFLNDLDILKIKEPELFGFITINNHKLQIMHIDKRQKRLKLRAILVDENHYISLSYIQDNC